MSILVRSYICPTLMCSIGRKLRLCVFYDEMKEYNVMKNRV